MTKIEAMQRVVEAARADINGEPGARGRLVDALTALDAPREVDMVSLGKPSGVYVIKGRGLTIEVEDAQGVSIGDRVRLSCVVTAVEGFQKGTQPPRYTGLVLRVERAAREEAIQNLGAADAVNGRLVEMLRKAEAERDAFTEFVEAWLALEREGIEALEAKSFDVGEHDAGLLRAFWVAADRLMALKG